MNKLRTPPKPRSLPTKHQAPMKKPTEQKAAARSHVTSTDFNPETGHLTVTFAGNRQYRYEGVDQKTADKLADAQSMGKFLHTHVIGKFDATKL